ncbi:MAG: glutamate-cysteine ligase family protein [Deltaproteobacteria bacterium]|nr:glutamate-cysteine ligase family protein [Deltaproteobacteria bacterium]
MRTCSRAKFGCSTLLLERLDARLLPTGMHPFMDPLTETRLWTSGSSEIYAAYDRIFDCRGHGWSNLQSMHLNLPFRGEAEFGRLQAALRLVLPILPALAASSPIADGRPQGARDFRIVSYKKNQALIPIITGRVVPEQYFTERDYERVVKEPIARAVAPHDPDGVLRGPWLDSRGLLPRFDRGSIEIRLLDTQECPRADLAVIALVVAVTRALVEERWSTLAEQQAWDVDSLARLLDACVVSAEETVIEDERFWGVFGLAKPDAPRAGVLWNTLYESVHSAELKPFTREIEAILSNGTLASRIVRATGHNPDRHSIEHVYRRLADCLDHGRMFIDAV